MDGVVTIIILFIAIITGAVSVTYMEKGNLGAAMFYGAVCLFNLATYAFQIQS